MDKCYIGDVQANLMCGSFGKLWFVGRLLAIVALCEFWNALYETLMVICNSPMDVMDALLFCFHSRNQFGWDLNRIFTKWMVEIQQDNIKTFV